MLLSYFFAFPFYIISHNEEISTLEFIYIGTAFTLNLIFVPGFFFTIIRNILHGGFILLIIANSIMNLIIEIEFEVSPFTNLYNLFIIFNSIEIFIFVIVMIIFHFNKRFWQRCYTLKVIEKNSDDNTIIFDSHIKSIKSHNFGSKIQRIIFKKNSKLETIHSKAFIDTKIKLITIPPSVINIESSAFAFCLTLKKVSFMEPSKIKEFQPYTFEHSHIESLYIPSSIVKLKKFWCCHTKMLKNVEISFNNPYYSWYYNSIIVGKNRTDDEIFENLVFAPRNINNVTIPSFIKQISTCAFEYCQKITEIDFAENSNLRIIGKYSFAFSSIVKIKIPSSVVLIDDCSFNECRKLKKVIFSNDSKLKIIGKKAFFNNLSLKSFMIPSSVIKVDDDAFLNCKKLEMLEIGEDSELITFDNDIFDRYPHLVIFAPKRILEFNGIC